MSASQRRSLAPSLSSSVTQVPPRRLSWAAPLLSGLYAWLSTVVSPAFALGDSQSARLTAVVAGCFLVVGTLPTRDDHGRRRAIGRYGFIGCCLITWLLCQAALRLSQLERGQIALGGLGWLLFSLSTTGGGSASALTRRPVLISGRTQGSRRFAVVTANATFVAVALAGLVPLFFAWDIRSEPHAAFAHLVACAAALSGFALAPGVGVALAGPPPSPSSGTYRWHIAGWLMATAMLLALGLALKVF